MNSLSWLLYIAGMVGTLTTVLAIFSFSFGVGALFSTVGYFAAHSFDYNRDHWVKVWAKAIKISWPIFIPCLLLTLLVPSSNTIYLIAASEIGEEIVTLPEVQNTARQALDLIQRRIERELTDLTSAE